MFFRRLRLQATQALAKLKLKGAFYCQPVTRQATAVRYRRATIYGGEVWLRLKGITEDFGRNASLFYWQAFKTKPTTPTQRKLAWFVEQN